MVEAAAGRPIVEFGARRAHAVEAGLYAARAAFVGGCSATSFLEAGQRFGIPVSGTMAHSWVMAFPDELEAFKEYAAAFGDEAVLLLDTYDTAAAARLVAASGLKPGAVRLDSGNIVDMSRAVRGILDAGGLERTKIFVSGDLDEWRIADLVARGAPVDAFGVGGALSTASDAPSLGGVYKLVEIERAGRTVPLMKLSPDKETSPGSKQIWRTFDADGIAAGDLVALAEEAGPPDGQPLLRRVMVGGRREQPRASLEVSRQQCRKGIASLPESVRRLHGPEPYPVRSSVALRSITARLSQRSEVPPKS
jgi:nicotinate phosphoribosyltransferase